MPHLSRWLGALALGSMLLASPALAQTLPTVGAYKDTTGKPQQGIGVLCMSGCASPTVPGNLATAQVSVGTSATQIVASRSGRGLVTVVQTSTTDIYLGPTSGVTTSTGLLLPGTKGASLTLPYTGALYGIVASGTATVTEAETY